MTTIYGPLSQRALLPALRDSIDAVRDAATAPAAARARATLRELLAGNRWHTTYIGYNLGTKRAAFLLRFAEANGLVGEEESA